MRKLRNGVRIKILNSRSFDDSELDSEDQIRIPIGEANNHNFESSLVDMTPDIMRKDSVRFLQRMNSKSPNIKRKALKEQIAFVRQKTKVES